MAIMPLRWPGWGGAAADDAGALAVAASADQGAPPGGALPSSGARQIRSHRIRAPAAGHGGLRGLRVPSCLFLQVATRRRHRALAGVCGILPASHRTLPGC